MNGYVAPMLPLLLLSSLAMAAENADASTYKVGAGDTLRLEVYGEEDLTRDLVISASCRIEVPLIGGQEVCGLTTEEIASQVQAELADGYLVGPTVFVGVATYGSQRATVKGAVKEPGVHVLEGRTTLSELITIAGGPDSPNVIHAQLITENGVQEYDLGELDARKDPVWIEPGQTVVLLPPVTVQVFGEVEESGPVAYRPGMTVTEALGLAGGATELAGLGRTRLLRAGSDKPMRVNVRRIRNGKDKDVVLQPDDQLLVRRSIF